MTLSVGAMANRQIADLVSPSTIDQLQRLGRHHAEMKEARDAAAHARFRSFRYYPRPAISWFLWYTDSPLRRCVLGRELESLFPDPSCPVQGCWRR